MFFALRSSFEQEGRHVPVAVITPHVGDWKAPTLRVRVSLAFGCVRSRIPDGRGCEGYGSTDLEQEKGSKGRREDVGAKASQDNRSRVAATDESAVEPLIAKRPPCQTVSEGRQSTAVPLSGRRRPWPATLASSSDLAIITTPSYGCGSLIQKGNQYLSL